MKVGQTVHVVCPRRIPSGGYSWHVETRQVVSADREMVCVCGTPSGRLAFHRAAQVYANVGIAAQVRDDYERAGLTPQEVFGE